jgi:hypothetical protein
MAQQQEPGLGLRQLSDGIQERAGLVDALSHSLLFAKGHTTNWRPQQREAGGGVDCNTRREDSSIDGRVRPTTWDQFTLGEVDVEPNLAGGCRQTGKAGCYCPVVTC